jgi:hypothetical protein
MDQQNTFNRAAEPRDYGRGLGMAVTTAPTPLAGVPSALAGIDATMQELANVLGNLNARLEQAGVLRSVPPRADNAKQGSPNFNSSLANSLDGQRQRLELMIAAIHELQERIDL